MTEREAGADHDPYYQHDALIGEGRFHDQAFTIRLKAHIAEEPYRHTRFHREPVGELVPLATTNGIRTYVLARPYILEPEIALTIGLYPQQRPSGAIGQVVRSEWEGMRHRLIGKAQAWAYPADRVLILWECFLQREFGRSTDPDDPNLHALWQGFEGFLLGRFPQTDRMVTPAVDPIYPAERWQAFLAARGFTRLHERAFEKGAAGV